MFHSIIWAFTCLCPESKQNNGLTVIMFTSSWWYEDNTFEDRRSTTSKEPLWGMSNVWPTVWSLKPPPPPPPSIRYVTLDRDLHYGCYSLLTAAALQVMATHSMTNWRGWVAAIIFTISVPPQWKKEKKKESRKLEAGGRKLLTLWTSDYFTRCRCK